MRIVRLSAMTGPNYDRHIEALAGDLQERVRALFAAHDFYDTARSEAGLRDWSELSQWAMFSNMYVRSQVLLIDQLTVKRKVQPSLYKVIEYAVRRPGAFARNEHPDALREKLGRVTVGVFTRDEAVEDLEKLKALAGSTLVTSLHFQPDSDHTKFEELVVELGGSPQDGFRLPTYPDLELKIDAVFELWLKYCEVFIGANFSRITYLPRSAAEHSYSAITNGWPESQFKSAGE